MITETVKISNRSGLHARPAMMIVQKAGEFNCDITIAKEDVKVNAKSIMGVMMLAAEYGASITLTADGADERAALDALKAGGHVLGLLADHHAGEALGVAGAAAGELAIGDHAVADLQVDLGRAGTAGLIGKHSYIILSCLSGG